VVGSPSRTELVAVADSCSPWKQRRAPLVRTTGDEAGDCGEGKPRRPGEQLEDDGDDDDSRGTGLITSELAAGGDGGRNHGLASTTLTGGLSVKSHVNIRRINVYIPPPTHIATKKC